ncbi:PadR family transcriptional regulator [Stygiolobus caldivivus]|uniref:PadR family transcriptional regulator n=1 Tax=Stygiolobus caldivivus TaxID=2824673 RepID=A0A8D5U4L4_9CREN|nr:PadR family transcriptional regulator [Stygiolobus caldivivus]BCU69326.1 PadR family transcriptional regulator [Stygiolobus caldivivus]
MKKVTIERMKRGALRFLVMSALTEKPMYVYEIIKHIESKTNGIYKPSPGSVYPVLRTLIKQGLITVEEKEGKKIYSITEEGLKKFNEIKEEKSILAEDSPMKRKIIDSLFEIGFILYKNRKKLDDKKMQEVLGILDKCKHDIDELFHE